MFLILCFMVLCFEVKTAEIDVKRFICYVQEKPMLWDKTLEDYKDRNLTKKCWQEVCEKLNPEFENVDDRKKEEFGRSYFIFKLIYNIKYTAFYKVQGVNMMGVKICRTLKISMLAALNTKSDVTSMCNSEN